MLPNPAARCVYPVPVPDEARQPDRLDWKNAPSTLLARLDASPGVVCIAGPVGSGKTTLARRLAAIADARIISTDDYLPDYDQTPEHLRDEPDSARLPELTAHLTELLAGRAAEIPVWSFHEHRCTGSRRVEPAPLLVVEGIHALHPAMDPVRAIGVLVQASARTRWGRWEAIESSGQRGWGVEKARAFFENVADPTFERHMHRYRARADFLVVNES